MAKQKPENATRTDEASPMPKADKLRCGIVMPLSAIDGCSEQHWSDVQSILFDAVESAGFTPHLVSDADDVGVIQKRIIQNLYENPIVVCDVSAKNPNVMFELGMRLAFDKPTIIIKDDKTDYSFDTAPIEHLGYPRDLRFGDIVAFKERLSDKIGGTHALATQDKGYTTFLGHFGKFTVAQVETTEVSKDEYVIDELGELKRMVVRLMSGGELPRSRRMTSEKWMNKVVSDILSEMREANTGKLPTGFDLNDVEARVASRFEDPDFFSSPGDFRSEVRRALSRLVNEDSEKWSSR